MTPAAFAAHLRRLADEVDKGDFLGEAKEVRAVGDDTLIVIALHFKQGGEYVRERINFPHKKG